MGSDLELPPLPKTGGGCVGDGFSAAPCRDFAHGMVSNETPREIRFGRAGTPPQKKEKKRRKGRPNKRVRHTQLEERESER